MLLEDVLEEEDEGFRWSAPADSARVHDQLRLGLTQKSHELGPVKIPRAPYHKNGAI